MKSVSEKKIKGHRRSKIVKSNQSYSNGHLPYPCSFSYLARTLDAWRGMAWNGVAWRGMWICVPSKDAQKQ